VAHVSLRIGPIQRRSDGALARLEMTVEVDGRPQTVWFEVRGAPIGDGHDAALCARGYRRVYLSTAADALRRQLGAEPNAGTRQAIEASDVVVLGGGGALGHGVPGPREHAACDYYWRVAWSCRMRRKPLYLLAVGAGPFSTARSRRRARDIAQMATAVIVRDEASRQALLQAAPSLAAAVRTRADAAFAFDVEAVPSLEPLGLPRPCLGVNLCGVSCFGGGLPSAAANREVIDAVGRLLREGAIRSVLWMATARAEELLWAARAAQETARHSRLVWYDGDPWAWLARLRECDAFLSMKLHSGVFAAAFGASLLGIGSHPKAQRFYDAVGAASSYTSLDRLRPGQIEPFLRAALPGAAGLRESPAWQRLRAAARRLFDDVPAAEGAPTAAPALVRG
jgi:polysaccharide pyruvyl transferase WcaK-like protein